MWCELGTLKLREKQKKQIRSNSLLVKDYLLIKIWMLVKNAFLFKVWYDVHCVLRIDDISASAEIVVVHIIAKLCWSNLVCKEVYYWYME